MPALMQKKPVFLTMTGPRLGPGSIMTQNNKDFGPLRRGQITPAEAEERYYAMLDDTPMAA